MPIDTALYLIPVTLGDSPLENVLPTYNNEIVKGIKHFIIEELRTARRFLKKVDKSINIDELIFFPMGKHSSPDIFSRYLEPLSQGYPIGIISEAGCPAVADPGSDIVSLAQKKGFRIVPLVGPCSMLMALMASGFNGQSFAFHGYLPIDPYERTKKIKHLENLVYGEHQTQLFIETPYRNAKMFEELIRTCRPQTRLCIAAGITCPEEFIRTRTIQEWKHTGIPDLHHIPAIFLVYK